MYLWSADQTSLEVYEYQGPAAAADLLTNIQGKYLSSQQNEENNRWVDWSMEMAKAKVLTLFF